jgi:hypothetical protein
LFVFFNGLVVELGRLIERGAVIIERGLEVLDLLTEPAQQVVTFARIGGP